MEASLLTVPFTGRVADVRRRERTAFVAVPFVASAAWYVLTLATITVVDGHLQLGADVFGLAVGAFTLGLLIATAATILFAVPMYLCADRRGSVRLPTALIAGTAVGTLFTVAGWLAEGRLWSSLFTPVHGLIGGMATAFAWWHLAGRPDRAPDPPPFRLLH
jgi:hypothetical protein